MSTLNLGGMGERWCPDCIRNAGRIADLERQLNEERARLDWILENCSLTEITKRYDNREQIDAERKGK